VGKHITFCPNRNRISRAKGRNRFGLEQNKQQMPSLNIARKRKLKLIPADLACKNEISTDGQSLLFFFASDDPKKAFLFLPLGAFSKLLEFCKPPFRQGRVDYS
jgi:hypothetical protein